MANVRLLGPSAARRVLRVGRFVLRSAGPVKLGVGRHSQPGRAPVPDIYYGMSGNIAFLPDLPDFPLGVLFIEWCILDRVCGA